MHCERFKKTITAPTACIYAGRCVPCHRKRLSQQVPRFLKEALSFVLFVLTLPFDMVREVVRSFRLSRMPLPFTRDQVLAIMSQSMMTGVAVIILRRIIPKEIVRIRPLPQLVGWRHYPGAHGKQPMTCECCQKGAYGSRKIREKYADTSE